MYACLVNVRCHCQDSKCIFTKRERLDGVNVDNVLQIKDMLDSVVFVDNLSLVCSHNNRNS